METSTEASVPQVHRSPSTFEVMEPVFAPNDKGKGGHLDEKYKNRAHPDDPLIEVYGNDPERLHNDRAPYKHYATEKPEHRMLVFLKAQGLSNKEIAERTGYSPITVGEVLRQPWARLRLVAELKEAGQDAIQSVLKGEALNSVFDIVDIRNDATTPKAVRLAADNAILDRYLGKPTQKTEVEDRRPPSSPEIAELDQQIKNLETQLKESTPPHETPIPQTPS